VGAGGTFECLRAFVLALSKFQYGFVLSSRKKNNGVLVFADFHYSGAYTHHCGARPFSHMNVDRSITRRMLDERLGAIEFRIGPPPERGWVRTLRDALGMSATELAIRMKCTQSRVSRIELAEAGGSLHLSTLRRSAEALNCRLVYALVPDVSLEDIVMRQAYLKATEELVEDDFEDRGGDPELVEEAMSEQLEVLTLNWVDRRGLWSNVRNQPVVSVVPPSWPPPESWGGAP
jgi:predicted DNA-binding mobile mystery protein A